VVKVVLAVRGGRRRRRSRAPGSVWFCRTSSASCTAHINIFVYEGASGLAFVRQMPHPYPVHGKNVAEENHPTTKDQVAAPLAETEKNGGKVTW
jgi:hypothetical protein